MSEPLVSLRVPYLPVEVRFGRRVARFEALLDTGFEGDVIVPEQLIAGAGPASTASVFRLADDTLIIRPI